MLRVRHPAAFAAAGRMLPRAFSGHSQWEQGRRCHHCQGGAAVVAAGALAALGLSGALDPRDGMDATVTPQACGIVGVVGTDNSKDILLEGLSILQNRGYDSAGIATIAPPTASNNNATQLVISKHASIGSTSDSIQLLNKSVNTGSSHEGHSVGIAHTRWATHGGKTDANAHPHRDQHNRIALVHNGTINNANELRRELVAEGVSFLSETDSEVIAQLIGKNLHENPSWSLRDAVSHSLRRCDGTWGLAIIDRTAENEVVVACNGSPLVIGVGQDKMYVASETTAFNRHTKNFIAMQDGEIGVVSAGGTSLDLSRVEQAPDQDVRLSPDPYPHWTIRECLEQPEAIARALAFGGRLSEDHVYLGGLDRNCERLEQIHHLVITGCGTSLNAGMYGAKLMRDLDAFDTVQAMDSAEMRVTDFPRAEGGLIAVSQSGETKDVHRAVKLAELVGVPALSVVNAVGSLIARTTQLGVYLNAGRENAVASTKAFTTQVTVLALLTCWFRQLREHTTDMQRDRSPPMRQGLPERKDLMAALQRLPISFGMAQRTRPQCQAIAKKLLDVEHLFVLGKGYGEPIAREGALKIKEITYLHAEAYSGGALKHGPFALIENEDGKYGRTPIIMLVLDDEHAHQMRTAAEEVKARGAEVIIITDKRELAEGLCAAENIIQIPRNGPLTALTAVLPLQLIAYELALLKGIDPDMPRNLAKAVTTD